MTADLHIHTHFSDGSLTPEEVVNSAIYGGVGLISVTDHDTMAGVDVSVSAAEEKGIKCAAGVEVSAYDGDVKFHTLGYGVDREKFKPFLDGLFKGSFLRLEEIVFKLNKVGVKITAEDAANERFSPVTPVHGMHIARAVLKKGYVKSVAEFFIKYIDSGAAFSRIGRPTPEETCEAISYAGGLAVVAHPGRIKMSATELEKRIKGLVFTGLGGIEVYYTTHTKGQTAYYKNLANSLGLFATGGSDTHVSGGNRIIGQPQFTPCERLLKRLNLD